MKNILNLTGIQQLTKAQQQKVNGGIRVYCKGGNRCCFVVNGMEYCEPGRCSLYGCVFY
ncbi:hypothetical protein [Tenacibaculum sp. M341]|uniref:hypothetical protein n=1 Tax=Tenacibaculum sp. M341 TaxID=2530339 RepID=UPI0014042C0A|nr:hypothetical protein [Tenacibaculum sp. M341]